MLLIFALFGRIFDRLSILRDEIFFEIITFSGDYVRRKRSKCLMLGKKAREDSYSVKISLVIFKKFVYMYIVYHIYSELIYQTHI